MKGQESVEVITAPNGKLVTKIVTSSGVVGFIANDVPPEAIQGLYQKLVAQLEKLDQAEQPESSANSTRFSGT